MPPTIIIPTTAQQQQMYQQQQQNSPLSIFNTYQQAQKAGGVTTPAAGSTNAVTAAGNPNLNNLSNPDWVKAMSEMISQINIDAQQKANASRIPNAAGLEQKSSGNIADALAGKLPGDVVNQIAQASAERGVSTGNPMGASTNADLLKSLGLSSLQLQGQGQSWLDQALGRNPSGQIANTQGLVTTPAQAESLALQRQGQELAYLSHLQDLAAGRYGHNYGYGGGSPSKGGSFAPATNWQTPTTTASPAPITTPWNLPTFPSGNLDTVLPGMDYYNPANDVVQPGNNYDPLNYGGSFDTVQPGMNYDPNNFDVSNMSQDELDWLYSMGGG